MTEDKPQRAVIYTRISSDRKGEGEGVARQEELCRTWASEHGWAVVDVLSDNDISASSGKLRPDFERLLERLTDGTYDALLCYHADRLYRSLTDLGRILAVHKKRQFSIMTLTGELNLGTDTGRMLAGILASVAAHEVERGTQRKLDAIADAAKAGKSLSKTRVFGWQADNVHLDESEAKAIADGYAGLLADPPTTSLGELGRLWAEQGLTTEPLKNRKGVKASGVWSAAKVQDIFKRERNCGRAVHHGKVLTTTDADGNVKPVMGQWEAIVSEEDHDRLQLIFAGRTVTRDNRRVHAISGLPKCGRDGCDGRMYVTVINKRQYYVCKAEGKGHLGISKDMLDYVVMSKLSAVLANPEGQAVQSLNIADTLKQIRDRQEALQQIAKDEKALATADISMELFQAKGEALKSKRIKAEAELASLMANNQAMSLVSGLTLDWQNANAGEAIGYLSEFHKRWEALTPMEQYLVLSTVLSITVYPETNHKGDSITRADRRVTIAVI